MHSSWELSRIFTKSVVSIRSVMNSVSFDFIVICLKLLKLCRMIDSESILTGAHSEMTLYCNITHIVTDRRTDKPTHV